MKKEAIIERHQSQTFRAFAIGFAPGFAYLGELDSDLRLARRQNPRTKVPAGAVAIADSYTAVYPQQSPGGWHIIGLLSPESADIRSLALKVGDSVSFVDALRG